MNTAYSTILDGQLLNALLGQRTTMKQYREDNPKPDLFDLIHKWQLSDEQKSQLDYYNSFSITAEALSGWLNKNHGRFYHDHSGRTYVPIYMYTTRRQIDTDATNHYTNKHKYYLSLRAANEVAIVLIQRARAEG